MARRIIFTILGLLLVIGLLAGIKFLQIRRMVEHGKQFVPPPAVVTTAVAKRQTWETTLTATGSLSAERGVTVAAEIPGKVVEIHFHSGDTVRQGDLLVRLDTSTEQAQLRAAEAAVNLARINLERARDLLKRNSMARAGFDTARSSYRQAQAQADAIRATMDKKQIRAPFAGRLGVRLVNLGQVLDQGTPVVTLQSIRSLRVDFYLPQQYLGRLRTGLVVRIRADSLGDKPAQGRITAINPEVDTATRNILVRARIPNPDSRLLPGMYVNVAVVLPRQEPVLAIPATAVQYAPFGDSVFVVEKKNGRGGSHLAVRQQFVRLGRTRGDFIAVRSGLAEGAVVVSTGVFKLRNGQAVKVDNTLSPHFELNPKPPDS
ncbi:MAG TPA: efflux RND transporter periplasmic adaptor subunit [Desulfobulbus sp.]|nr:efflux RND transporter periplasmic adaptor subunit [Desulfobulbus sp.]